MPGDKKHHTEKFRRCVDKLLADGKEESSAYAICTTSLQDAGEPIFEGAESRSTEEFQMLDGTLYSLHLCGATGQVKIETINGREHLVVPVVAMVEGVIHPVNAETPEFVPWEAIERIAASFNGKPAVLNHPEKDGKQCSASLPGMLDSHGIGLLRNARAEKTGKRLLMEALIDATRAKQLHPEMYQRLAEGKSEEVSVGALVVTDSVTGEHNGKRFKAKWLGGSGDHLAFLPGKRGACSVAMGCGAHRAAEAHAVMHLVTAEGIEPAVDYAPVLAFTTLEETSLDERMRMVYQAVQERWQGQTVDVKQNVYPDIISVFDDRVLIKVNGETFAVNYDVKDGKVLLGEAKRVKQAWVAAARKKLDECPSCKGLGQKDGKDCETCDGNGQIRHAAMAALLGTCACTKSLKDLHDHAMKTLGARPGHPFYGNQHSPITGPPIVSPIAEEANKILENIKFEGGHYTLYGSDGKLRLGQYKTKNEAEEHGRAIQQKLAQR